MDDMDLAALMAELQQVQKAPSVFKLSEPNVVEVMQKLAELGLVDVLFTSNGKEYLTPKQLRNEVEDEILAQGGRINITELAPILNVDLPYVERAVDELLKKDATLQLFHGEIIATYYLDGVAEEVNQTLQGAGRITLAELAVQYTLPTDFMTRVIEPRLGSAVSAKLAGGVLYTNAYVTRHAARVRGALCACLKPTSLATLVKEHGFNEALFHESVDALKLAGRLPGSVQGKSSYTPAVHAHAQVSSVRAFFEQNGVIEYSALSKMAVRDPQAYLEATFPDGIVLASSYMKASLLEAVEVEFDEACRSRSALDVRASFDVELSDADVEVLLRRSTVLQAALSGGRAVRLSPTGSLLAPAALVTECAEAPQLKELVAASAEQQSSAAAAKGGGGGGKAGGKAGGKGAAAGMDDEEDGGGGGKKGGKAAKGGNKRAARRDEAMAALAGGALDDSDEEDLMGGGGGGGGGGGKKGKGGKKGGGKKGGKAGGGGGGGGGGAADDDEGDGGDGGEAEALLLESISTALDAFRPSLSEAAPSLSSELAAHLLPQVQSAITQALIAKREAGASDRRKATLAAQEAVSALGLNVHLFAKGASALSESLPPRDNDALEKALLKGTCTDLVNALIKSEALHAGAELPPPDESGGMSAAARKEALSSLPGPAQRAIEQLEKAASSKSTVQAFLEALKAGEATLGACCPPLDKKREKAALDKAKADIKGQLAAESQPAVVLHLAVVLLHIELGGVLLEATSKLLLPLIECLEAKPDASADALGTLAEYAKALHAHTQGGEAAEAAAEELSNGIEAVRSIGLSGGKAG